MWNFMLVLWLGGALGTFGSIMGQHINESPSWPRLEECSLMLIMAVLWFIAIPYTLWVDRPGAD